MAPDAAGVGRQESDRARGLGLDRADAVDVVLWGDQLVEIPRDERPRLDQLERAVALGVDVLVLRALVEAYEPPREVVVHRGLRARRHHQREERERAIFRAEEKPLADPAAHA